VKQKRFGLSSLEAESVSASLNGTDLLAPASRTSRRSLAVARYTPMAWVLAQATELVAGTDERFTLAVQLQ
jgi:hypothetical protein